MIINPLTPPPLQHPTIGSARDEKSGKEVQVRISRDWLQWFSRFYEGVIRTYSRVLNLSYGGADSTTGLVAATIDVTETALASSFTLPASYLVTGKRVRISYSYEMTTSGAPVSFRTRLRLGGAAGTIVYDTTAIVPTINLAAREFRVAFTLTGTAGAGATANVYTSCDIGASRIAEPAIGANTVAQPVAVATNTALAITLTMQFGGNTAGNLVKIHSMCVEELI